MKKRNVSVGFGLFVVMAFYCGLFATGVSAQEHAAAAPAAKSLFSSRCAMCHGADGHGSDMGKSLKVKDLTSKEVQSESDTDLAHVIATGKNNMPPFKDSLKEEEIHGLVQYLRTLK
jgi:mono/diheme cytochrome c family protein